MLHQTAQSALRTAALGLFGLTLFALVPGAARAQASADGAHALEQQIHDWISNTLGPNAKIADRPIQVTADGDHYNLAIPFGSGADAPNWTATARAQSGGRWQIDNIRVPSPAEFHLKLPAKLAQGAPPAASQTIDYKLTIGQQAAQLMLDPTFATTTTWTSSVQDVDMRSSGGMAPQTSHIDRGSGSLVIQPGSAGHIDVSLDSNLEGYNISAMVPNAPEPFKIAFGKAHVKAGMDSVSRERAVQILQALVQLGQSLPGNKGIRNPGAPTRQQSAAILLDAFADLATGASIDENLQNVDVSVRGLNGSLQAMQIGFGIKGTGGLLQAYLDLGAAGLTLPELGLGSLVGLIPTRVSLHPSVSGVPAAALMALAKASNDGKSPGPENLMALFAQGPIMAGLDSLVVDVAGAEFTGLGKVRIASPQDIGGTAQLTATNFDLLQQRIAAEPSLAQFGAAIIFLKGIGRSVGNQLVWDITYRGGHVLVNNQDLTELAGGGQHEPSAQQPATQPQTDQPQLRRR